MICVNNKTTIKYNYRFVENNSVEIWDGEDYTLEIPYEIWCKEYYIIDKWRCLNDFEIKNNKEILNNI